MSKFTEDLVFVLLCKVAGKVFSKKKEKKPAKVSTEHPIKPRIKQSVSRPQSKRIETNLSITCCGEESINIHPTVIDQVAPPKIPKEDWVSSYDGQEEFQVEVQRGKSLATIEVEKVEHWCGNVYLVTPRDGLPYYVTGMKSEWKHLL